MTTVIIDNNSRTGRRLLKDIAKHPRVARIINGMNTPLSTSEEEPVSLEEFKKNFEDAIYEDLGLKIIL
jgi:hypothetical protein